MSEALSLVELLNLQNIGKRRNDGKNLGHQIFHYCKVDLLYLLCCPVFIPQITGDPVPPGFDMLKESVTQSPIPLPKKEENLDMKCYVIRSVWDVIWIDHSHLAQLQKKLYHTETRKKMNLP